MNGDADEAKRWEMEEQQVGPESSSALALCRLRSRASSLRWDAALSTQTIMRRQDDTLGVISGTLTTLASQAGLIGSEVNDQSECVSSSFSPSCQS